MKNIVKTGGKMLSVAALAMMLLLPPVMMRDAMALFGASCTGPGDTRSCPPPSSCQNIFGTNQCVPEMSDYLGMAFVVIAGGMIYWRLRRTPAVA